MSKQACEFVKQGSDALLKFLEPRLDDDDYGEVEYFVNQIGSAIDELDMEAQLHDQRITKLERDVDKLQSWTLPIVPILIIVAAYALIR